MNELTPMRRPPAGSALDDFSALDLWRRTLVRAIRSGDPDLTQRQLAIILAVYLTPAPHTVRGLAEQLRISKPAVTRALDRLTEFGFVRRKTDTSDRRSVLVQRTVKGAVYLRTFGGQIATSAAEVAREPLGIAAFAAIDGKTTGGQGKKRSS